MSMTFNQLLKHLFQIQMMKKNILNLLAISFLSVFLILLTNNEFIEIFELESDLNFMC
jgi:hypothetical protein